MNAAPKRQDIPAMRLTRTGKALCALLLVPPVAALLVLAAELAL